MAHYWGFYEGLEIMCNASLVLFSEYQHLLVAASESSYWKAGTWEHLMKIIKFPRQKKLFRFHLMLNLGAKAKPS